jgi:hypothetical protein
MPSVGNVLPVEGIMAAYPSLLAKLKLSCLCALLRGPRSMHRRRYNSCLLWRGAKETATFYRFWRVRLALHVTAKGIYIPGFCTLTFIYIYFHFIHSFIFIYIYILIYTFTQQFILVHQLSLHITCILVIDYFYI